MAKLETVTIRGFKSIAELNRIPLGDVNVLIGANGSGKSNFVDFFRILAAIGTGGFQSHMSALGAGGGDTLFHNGPKVTPEIFAQLWFGQNGYEFELMPADDGTAFFKQETTYYKSYRNPGAVPGRVIGSGTRDPQVYALRNKQKVVEYVHWSISGWKVYHFHDTSRLAPMRRPCEVEPALQSLKPDASNLGAFLRQLKSEHEANYRAIVKMVQRIAPYFEDFVLPSAEKPVDRFMLSWKQNGVSDPFSAQQFSDGTMRFICMVTALLQPNPPTMLVLDEPELGLHPEALGILASLMKSASERMQLIVATQSPVLLSEFDVEDVITVDQVDGASVFNRLDEAGLEQWLDEYCLGDLWQKGIIRGGVNNG